MGIMSNASVSAIVVTIGKDKHFRFCLDSLVKQTHQKLEIIVIDNSADENLATDVQGNYPRVNLYRSGKNLFYCEALNKGIEMSKGDFILCLNDDVVLDEGFIAEALKGFSHGACIGSVSGKILRSNRQTIDSAGLYLGFCRTAKERGYGQPDTGQFEKAQRVFGVNGAAAFYRRETLGKIRDGGQYFDRDFRFFYEDLDVAWRARRAGWTGYYMPTAIAYHIRGLSARSCEGIDKLFARRFLNDELHADLIKNRYLAIIKNESIPGFLLHLPGIIFYDLVIWSYVILFRPRQIKIFFSKSKYLKSALRKRKEAGIFNG